MASNRPISVAAAVGVGGDAVTLLSFRSLCPATEPPTRLTSHEVGTNGTERCDTSRGKPLGWTLSDYPFAATNIRDSVTLPAMSAPREQAVYPRSDGARRKAQRPRVTPTATAGLKFARPSASAQRRGIHQAAVRP